MTHLQIPLDGIPEPTPSMRSQPFWDGCAQRELRYQWCPACRRALSTPAIVCPFCLTRALEWRPSAGRGTIYSASVVWRAQTPSFGTPYAVVIVELDEGFHLTSNLIGCDSTEARIGRRVRLSFETVGTMEMPYFRLDDAPHPDGAA